VIIFCFVLFGALIGRWHGGGFFSAPRIFKNIIWAAPFGLCSFFALLPVTNYFVAGIIATISFGICIAGKATGHGRVWNPWLPLDLSVSREKLEIPYLIGKIPDFAYKTLILSIIGFGAVAGASAVFGYIDIWLGLIVAAGGLIFKPMGYIIGFRLDKRYGNEFAEYFAGAGAFGLLGVSFKLIGGLYGF